MKKLQKDLARGDKIHVEFGDYDSWVDVIVDEVDGRKLLTHTERGRTIEMYGDPLSLVEVLEAVE